MRVVVETVEPDDGKLSHLLQAVHDLSEEARRNGLTDKALDAILRDRASGS